MSEFLYHASVPVFERYLRQLRALLDKAESHPDAQALLTARIAPTMLAFAVQVEVTANFAVRACAPLAGRPERDSGEFAPTYAGLRERIDHVLGFLGALTPGQFDGAAKRRISDPAGEAIVTLPGREFLLEYALPNFFFHMTCAYAILRQGGVRIGKADFDGFHLYPV